MLVGGATAENIDYSDVINHWLPIVLAFVLGLSFLLLTVVFRSIVLSATAVVLNLLSVGAAYGLLVLVFQHGFGVDLLGFQQVERVEAWVPIFLFSVLFALSMDYHVFLLTRIRERYAQTGDTDDAVVHGIAATGRIITGAALIIVACSPGFAAGAPGDVPADGLRRRRRAAPRRHPRSAWSSSRRDGPARPLELVPAELARPGCPSCTSKESSRRARSGSATAIPTANTTSVRVAGRAADVASWENPVRAVRTPTATKPTPATAAIQPSLRPRPLPNGEAEAQAEQGEPVDEVEEGAEPLLDRAHGLRDPIGSGPVGGRRRRVPGVDGGLECDPVDRHLYGKHGCRDHGRDYRNLTQEASRSSLLAQIGRHGDQADRGQHQPQELAQVDQRPVPGARVLVERGHRVVGVLPVGV